MTTATTRSRALTLSILVWSSAALAQVDPGVRGGPPAAGHPLPNLTASELAFFEAGLEDFEEAEGIGDGLGPRFNLDGCGGCHLQPAVGGTSGPINPQVGVATAFGARNTVPPFITVNGPIREARFKRTPSGARDGGVHGLFVISGRADNTGDAAGCNILQPNFAAELANNNVIFRIPTPVFGTGLIEEVPDRLILQNLAANAAVKSQLGISGRVNRNESDGRITRFGWKAQNVSGLFFSGEAYNVEMGITNEMFQVERDETPECQEVPVPNDVIATDAATPLEAVTAIDKFAVFMRFLAPPTPSTTTPGGNASITEGFNAFVNIGCVQCHTRVLRTENTTVAALRNRDVVLFSDLALHNMGPGLADDIVQGMAAPDEFRTAPLWGLGQRIFFLHDGRTSDLLQAIQAHRSNGNSTFGPSEANTVVDRFNALPAARRQDMLNFLRSL
ncbi:MAG: di-heme oxidoredictase family protein [Steroidobacteraceae bacterium]